MSTFWNFPYFLSQCCEMTSDKTLQTWWWQQESQQSLSVFLPEAILNRPSTGRKIKCELRTKMTGSLWVLLPCVLISGLISHCDSLLSALFLVSGQKGKMLLHTTTGASCNPQWCCFWDGSIRKGKRVASQKKKRQKVLSVYLMQNYFSFL